MSQPGSCGPALDAFYATLSDEQKEQHRKSCTLVFMPTDAQRAKFGSSTKPLRSFWEAAVSMSIRHATWFADLD
jgi:hypothetical protein